MQAKKILFFLVALIGQVCLLSGQELSINLTYSRSYSVAEIGLPLYSIGQEERVGQLAREICARTGVQQNFRVVSATVPTITLVRDSSDYYLLYNPVYAQDLLEENPGLLYALVAHATGHFAREHTFKEKSWLKEESSADEFLGRALFQLPNFTQLEDCAPLLAEEPFVRRQNYSPEQRFRFVAAGWKAAEGVLLSNDNLGYLNSEETQRELNIPAFKLSGCPRFFPFPESLLQSCRTMADVDRVLQAALQKLGYDRHGYFHLPNGFVVLTDIEQITEDGTPFEGQHRWHDYPSNTDYEGILQYLSQLLLPTPGYFRLFGFAVTDQNIEREDKKMDATVAKNWLESGGHLLPPEIGQQPILPSVHKASVFIYEFTAPKSTNIMKESCDNLLSTEEHLRQSGLRAALDQQ